MGFSSSLSNSSTASTAGKTESLLHEEDTRRPLKKREVRIEPHAGNPQVLGGAAGGAGGEVEHGNSGGVGVQATGGTVGVTGQGMVASPTSTEASTTGGADGAPDGLVDAAAAQDAVSAPSPSAGGTPSALMSARGGSESSSRATGTTQYTYDHLNCCLCFRYCLKLYLWLSLMLSDS